MPKPTDRVQIDLQYRNFEDAILTALEKDTGAIPIVPEILRIIKIKERKERIHAQRIANLKKK